MWASWTLPGDSAVVALAHSWIRRYFCSVLFIEVSWLPVRCTRFSAPSKETESVERLAFNEVMHFCFGVNIYCARTYRPVLFYVNFCVSLPCKMFSATRDQSHKYNESVMYKHLLLKICSDIPACAKDRPLNYREDKLCIYYLILTLFLTRKNQSYFESIS